MLYHLNVTKEVLVNNMRTKVIRIWLTITLFIVAIRIIILER